MTMITADAPSCGCMGIGLTVLVKGRPAKPGLFDIVERDPVTDPHDGQESDGDAYNPHSPLERAIRRRPKAFDKSCK